MNRGSVSHAGVWRGFGSGIVVLLLAVVLAGCHGGPHLVLVVTTTIDGPDLAPGDGVCEMTTGLGDCSLRAALDEWTSAGADAYGVVVLPSDTYPLPQGPLEVGADARELTIRGLFPGAAIDAAGASHAAQVSAGSVTFDGIAVTGAADAGIVVADGAESILLRAASHGNGGAGVEIGSGGTASVLHSTLSGNGGPGVANGGSVALAFATVTANAAGGVTGASGATLGASIIADQAAGDDCDGAVVSTDFNLDSDASCGLAGGSDLSGSAPGLGSLTADLVPRHVPGSGSPAIDSLPSASPSCGGFLGNFDQVGQVRPAGAGCDRGAIEANLLENGNAETGAVAPWSELEGSGFTVEPAPPGTGAFAFHPETTPVTAAIQGLTVTDAAALIDAGSAVTSAGGTGHRTVDAALTVHFWDASFAAIGSAGVPLPATAGAFGTGDVAVPAGTRYMAVIVGWDDLADAADDWVDDLYLVPPH